MAGIKIHQYPLERTSIGDDDYYDIDYWTGSSYQTAKIKGSTLKNVLGANYIDITAFISGYELTDKDAGKLITNSSANVRTLVIPSGLALPNNMITVKGRIAIQPETGVNITLPDGSTITDPSQFTCVADEVYILHKSAFTGDNYILISVKKSENIGTNDLIITDTIRELQVATDGTLQIVTNDANNSAVFKIGENSNERFSEIKLNSITYDVTTAEPNPTNNGAGIITRINPNEYEVESRSDIGNSATKRSRIYTSPNEVVLEKSSAGKLTLNSLGASNTFEDLRSTKKGLEYSADYSTNFSVRSLVDKGYVDAGLSTKIGAVVEDTTPQLGGDLDLNNNDINGTGNVDVTGNVIADIVKLRGGTGTQGEMSWSTDEETVQLVMDGTTLHIGQDTLVVVRNNTASIITKGTAVYATGTLGASGRITVAPMIADGTIEARLFIGLASEDITAGTDGQVMTFGKIRQINTSGYTDGDVLWLSDSVAGELTTTEPSAPSLKIATAFVIHAATNGTLMVRAEQGNDLHSDQRVQVSGLTNNDVLTWNNANQRWQNAQPTSTNIYTNNGTIGSNRVATLTDTLSFSGGRVSFDTTTDGILLPRLTTAQMNAVASPVTNTILYNTDLNGLYRYNGSAWVALSAGYGIIGVYSGSGNGTPTFFADLQSALETCKASGGYFTVKLYSNITTTSTIEIDYANSGVGNAYLFRQLTIDFNGFSVTNAQADTSDAFTVELSNSASVYQEIRFINGSVLRTNGTGTHHALKCDTSGRCGSIQMSNMYWYCQNGFTASISLNASTNVETNKINDLGGSVFISNNQEALRIVNSTTHVTNFKAKSNSSTHATVNLQNSRELSNFIAENTNSSTGLNVSGSNSNAYNFSIFTNSGTGVTISAGTLDNFKVVSVSGRGIDADLAICNVSNFTSTTGNNFALKVLGSGESNANFSNGKCINNGATQCVLLQNCGSGHNIEAINNGSGVGLDVRNNQNTRSEFTNCKGISEGGVGGVAVAGGSNVTNITNCEFVSRWNNSGGHSLYVEVTGGGSLFVTNTHFKVRNSSANAIYAAVSSTVKSRYCTHNDVASTPINANVTIVSSGIIS